VITYFFLGRCRHDCLSRQIDLKIRRRNSRKYINIKQRRLPKFQKKEEEEEVEREKKDSHLEHQAK
jgi:hypothetical protein